MQTKQIAYRTRAAFRVGNSGWRWETWTNHSASKHAAILDKAKELGAVAWDFGQADHDELSRSRF